jgi:hypothetical protein
VAVKQLALLRREGPLCACVLLCVCVCVSVHASPGAIRADKQLTAQQGSVATSQVQLKRQVRGGGIHLPSIPGEGCLFCRSS